jgi:hypothetical protein
MSTGERGHDPGRRVALGCFAAVAAALAGASAQAADDKRSYAVLSLIGDRMEIITRHAATGSNMDRNARQELPLQDDTFDVAAARAAGRIIREREPGARVELFAPRDPKLYALQDQLADSDRQAESLAASLREVVAQSGATHIVLISKYRTEARVKVDDGSVGSGKLSGIGFYVDPDYEPADPGRRTGHIGFFAPYAYLRVTLLDAATRRPSREEVTTEARPYGTERSNRAAVAWDALTAAQKVAALREVVEAAVQRAVPPVLPAR